MAHEITRLAPAGDLDRISQSLFDAFVDLEPHRIASAEDRFKELDAKIKDELRQDRQATTLSDRINVKELER